MTEPLKLLAVFPHPDDESLGLGGVLAKYAAEGVETHLICATRGQKGWPGEEDDNPGPDELGRIREIELRCAAKHLCLHQVHLLDYCDGELEQTDPEDLIARIVPLIRRIQPHVVITFAQDGVYGHPDHIVLAQATSAALVCAADSAYLDMDQQPAFRVPKYYAAVNTKSVVETFTSEIGAVGMEVNGVLRTHVGWEEWAVNARIDVSDYFDKLWRAILCHQSQMPAFGPLVNLKCETLQKIFNEGTLVRNYSLVNRGLGVETDLFDGLRDANES